VAKSNLVIYHANCDDGFGAAWCAWKALGEKETDYFAAGFVRPFYEWVEILKLY